jgi:ABC-type transporter Mla MlaB component
MATKDDRPGLLSKVAMFVRNPTRDWSELEQPSDNDSGGYDKQALKAMIERKRQNDFVRKREFDQLRKLRNRDPGTMASMARPSFFQTSLPNDSDGRAGTIRKIDEIEAQMSRQWWKNKSDSAAAPVLPQESGAVKTFIADSNQGDSEPYLSNTNLSAPFASTEPYQRDSGASTGGADEFLPTQMASVPATSMEDTTQARSEPTVSFSTSRLFAIDVDEMATDPELEEAASRFANSDDVQAERGLLQALRASKPDPRAAQSWAAALLDLYRATRNQPAFEHAATEFSAHLEGVLPIWSALDLLAPAGDGASLERAWTCPEQLNVPAMESLRQFMLAQPMPWHLAWGGLQTITPETMPLLDGMFDSLCEEAVSLRFAGADRLLSALRVQTPTGDRLVPALWWRTRLNALRVMGLQDEFELAALDFCVTYETAPPDWVTPHCRLEGPASEQTEHAQNFGARTVPMGEGADVEDASLVLQGEVVGDASQAMAVLDAVPAARKRLVIDCHDLIRVDFAAAGNLLNWVAMRQAEGRQVQFQNVHRLVAAFFNVIGINEHAKVIPRPI